MTRLFRITALPIIVTLMVSTLGAFQASGIVQAKAPQATATSVQVGCAATTISGHVDVSAPYVRLDVATAAYPITTIADVTAPVQPDGSFTVVANYPLQPAGTHLIGGYGEWTGSEWVNPATMFGADCASPTPNAPTGLSSPPVTSRSDPTIRFSWDPVAGATYYHIQVGYDANFTRLITDLTDSASYSIAPRTWFPGIYGPGLPNGTYYWHVRAYNTYGYGVYSNTSRVTVNVPRPWWWWFFPDQPWSLW